MDENIKCAYMFFTIKKTKIINSSCEDGKVQTQYINDNDDFLEIETINSKIVGLFLDIRKNSKIYVATFGTYGY